MKVMCVMGTRPEAIKMCPLLLELKKRGMQTVICASGQHGEMFDRAMAVFSMAPDVNFRLMKKTAGVESLVGELLLRLPKLLTAERPALLLVHGDTATALAGGLCGFWQGIPVCHVEAGLRTYNMAAPFPEEFNRRTLALVSAWHMAPTARAGENLLREGIAPCRIHVVGNTGLDALRYTVRERECSRFAAMASGRRIVTVTAHRRENHARLGGMAAGIASVLRRHDELFAVVSAHPNPVVRNTLGSAFAGLDNVLVTEPLDVPAFHSLLASSYLVLTDSGGVQEEAMALHVPTLVMRDVTERDEGVESGGLCLVGCRGESVASGFEALLADKARYLAMCRAENPFGDGRASERIADILCNAL